MKRRGGILSVGLAAAVLITGACEPAADHARRGRVRVAAASDLNAALAELMPRFSAAHGVDVVASYGSSGTFYAQLLNGAPFDVFLSADAEYPRRLAGRGLTLDGDVFTYAIGRLVLWVPASSRLEIDGREHGGLPRLGERSVRRVAIANPEHAPYGRAAVAAMQAAGVYDGLKPKLVLGENVAQALQFAQSGAADAGIVALSLAVAPSVKSKGRFVEIPDVDYPRIEQAGAILKSADPTSAAAFRAYITGAEGRTILQQYGFGLPDR